MGLTMENEKVKVSSKQVQEIIFSRKTTKRNHPDLMFNNSIVNLTTVHKF